MSDHAATEKAFHERLKIYRENLFKEHMLNYDELGPEDQCSVTKLYNFFCGLHLLVNIAEGMNAVFKEWEKTKEIVNKSYGNYSSSNDSSTIMFVRESCKAFATGGNKNMALL